MFGRFIRYIVRAYFIRDFFLTQQITREGLIDNDESVQRVLPIGNIQEDSPLLRSSAAHPDAKRCLGIRLFGLLGRTTPLANEAMAVRAARTDNFFLGAQDFTEKVWPIGFYSLLAHDLFSYFLDHENRYGNTIKDIFLGLPSNQQTLTTYLPNFWWYITGLAASPILLGIWQCGDIRQITDAEALQRLNSHQASFLKDTIGWLINPFAKDKRALRQIQRALLWKKDAYAYSEENHFLSILQFFRNSSGLAKLSALSALARIADIDIESHWKFGDDDNFSAQLAEACKQALVEIGQNAASSKNFIRYCYANYLLWSLGHFERRFLEPVFWIYTAVLVYAKLRLGEAFAQFTYQDIKWLINRYNCHQEHKVWKYITPVAEYQCTVCGNWSDIAYRNVFSAQSCLDDFLGVSRTPQEVSDMLYRTHYFGFSSLNLSRQDWDKWPHEQFDYILNLTLAASQKQPLARMDLSCDFIDSQEELDPQNAYLLAEFFNKTGLIYLDLHNRGIGANATAIIVPFLTGNNLTYFDLSGNAIGIQGMDALASAIYYMPQLQVLKIAANNLTDTELLQFAVMFKNATIKSLYLGNNRFGQKGLDALAGNFSSQLEELDLSDNDFSKFILQNLGRKLQNAQALYLAGTNIGDDEFNTLCLSLTTSELRVLDVSNNQLTADGARVFSTILNATKLEKVIFTGNSLGDDGLAYISAPLVNSSIRVLVLKKNAIGDSGIKVLSRYLPHTPLTVLNLAYNQLSELAAADLTVVLPDSQVLELDVSGNELGDVGVTELSKALAAPRCPIRILRLSDNGITAEGAYSLARVFSNHSLVTELSLSHNPVQDMGFSLISGVLPHSNVTVLDVTDCNITYTGMQAFVPILNQTALQSVWLGKNALSDESAYEMAAAMVSYVPHNNILGDRHISRDLRRAIWHAHEDTEIRQIFFAGSGIGTDGIRAFCRVLSPANISSFDFFGNPVNTIYVDPRNCWISSGTRLKPPLYDVAFLPVFAEVGADYFNLYVSANDLLECALLIACVFHNELYAMAENQFPESIRRSITQYADSNEGILVKDISSFMLRMKYAGPRLLLYDVVSTLKQAYLPVPAIEAPKEKQEENEEDFIAKAASGLLRLGGAYGVAWAINTLTGNPLLGYLLMPVVMHGKEIVEKVTDSYRAHGFFRAVETGFDTIAASVPGGRVIARALERQEQSIRFFKGQIPERQTTCARNAEPGVYHHV